MGLEPMAEAGAEVSIRCIPWRDAVVLLAGVYGSSALAEERLVQWLRAELVRWTCQLHSGGGSTWALPTAGPGRSGKFWRLTRKRQYGAMPCPPCPGTGCSVGEF